MKKHAVKYAYSGNPFWLYLKKHVCPQCKGKVERHIVSKIVNSDSQEAREYDFSNGDTYISGDVEFRTRCFYCPSCKLDISDREMRKYERLR